MSLPDGPFIFVSYSSKDSDFVHPEIERLKRQGYRIWYDKGRLQPGRLWDEEIRQAIAACACFIVFITQDAVDSEPVLDEIDQALKAGKPFICIHWEKVKVPPRFQKPFRKIQALERYALRRFEYEEPLSRALSAYVERAGLPAVENDGGPRVGPAPTTGAAPDMLPKVVFFALMLLGVILLLLAGVLIAAPHFASATPGDPLNNRLAGLLSGLLFAAIACGLGGAAFAVHRVYLRRKNG